MDRNSVVPMVMLFGNHPLTLVKVMVQVSRFSHGSGTLTNGQVGRH